MDKTILVTGGTGYIASWVIKYLLEAGYAVHATVRDKSNKEKTGHLHEMAESAPGTLKLFEADLLEEGAFEEAMKGCGIVMHMASPFFVSGVKDGRKQLVEPALKGTRNVLNAVNKTETVSRVVLTSSVVAIYGDNKDIESTTNGIFTEEYWNQTSSESHQPYPYSKTVAEKEAWKIKENQDRWDLLVINPGMVLGPSLSKRIDSTSISFMRSLLNGEFKQGVPDLYFGVVDVRDVAKAHIQAAFRNEANGRHILVAENLSALEMAKILRKQYADRYPIPKKKLPNFMLYIFGPFQGFSWKYINRNIGVPLKFDNSYSKKDLGVEYRNLEETLTEHAEQVIQDGLLKK